MKKIAISDEEYAAIVTAEKKTQNKHISRKLKVLIYRHDGFSDKEIAEKVGLCEKRCSQLAREYRKVGLAEFTRSKYGGNHRSLSEAEEDEILEKFRAQAENGQIVVVQEIKKEFDKKLEKDTGNSYIYRLLARKGWRKVMPRSKHPQKADAEAINASKKLKTP